MVRLRGEVNVLDVVSIVPDWAPIVQMTQSNFRTTCEFESPNR